MVDIPLLQKVQEFVDKSNESNSGLHKKAVIEDYKHDRDMQKVFRFVYNPFFTYGVSSKNCLKHPDKVDTVYDHLFHLLHALNNRDITGHTAIACVNGYVEQYKEYEELIWRIIDRNLKTRSTASLINKIIPDCIPTFDVSLGRSYDEKTQKKVNFDKDEWYMSRKLDGVRCVCVVDEDSNCTFYSRSGKPFLTLDKIAQKIKEIGLGPIVLDGEICIVDENGNEDFQSIMKEIRRKDHTIENPSFLVFDILTHDNFFSGVSSSTFEDRLFYLNLMFQQNDFDGILKEVEQIKVESNEQFEAMRTESQEKGWEGLILRRNERYKGKRSDDLMKVKLFHDDEYIVKGIETAIQRIIEEGQEVEEEMLKSVIIEHKGCEVNVGSGFSLDQRRHFYNNPEDIIGKEITVTYFEESKNDSGGYSLRFPVFKVLYENGRDV
jgi:DNA ligase-1